MVSIQKSITTQTIFPKYKKIKKKTKNILYTRSKGASLVDQLVKNLPAM